VAYDNFAAGNQFEPFHSLVCGAINNNWFVNACPFTTQANGAMSQLTIALARVSGPTQALIALRADDGGGHVGAVLGSWTLNNLPDWTGDPYTPPTLDISAGPTLIIGQQYWLEARAVNPSATLAWNLNNIGRTGTIAVSNL